jgi:amino acid transporter
MTTQKLKLLDTALYSLATGIGMRWIAVAAAVGPSSLPLWLLALVVFFIPLSVATAELTARYEAEGGIYAWVRDSLGPLPGFLCGWFYWIGLMPYFASITFFLSGLILAMLGGDPQNPLLYTAISGGLVLLVTALQLAGLSWGKWLPNLGAAGGWVVLGVILAIGAALGGRGEGATDFAHSSYLPPLDFDTAILWGTIFFAYSGVESVAFLRNEIEGGMRTIIRALIVLGIGSVVVYIAGTSSFLVILPKEALTRLAGFPDALRIGLERVHLGMLAPAVIGLFALSMMGSFTGWFGVAARLPFAAGIDSYLPKVFAWRHPRTGAPIPALLLQAALTLVMVGLSQAGSSVAGAYDFLVAMSVLGTTVPYVFMFAGYLKASQMPPVPGAWAPPGGMRTSLVLGWIAQVATLIAIACTLVPSSSDPNPWAAFVKIVTATAVMTAVGLGVYWAAQRRRVLPAG